MLAGMDALFEWFQMENWMQESTIYNSSLAARVCLFNFCAVPCQMEAEIAGNYWIAVKPDP